MSESIEGKGALANANLKGILKKKKISVIDLPKGAYLYVRPYRAILSSQRSYQRPHHSEIMITGKEGVYIHAGMPRTKAVRVKEILVTPHDEIEWCNGIPLIRDVLKYSLELLNVLNTNIPINLLR